MDYKVGYKHGSCGTDTLPPGEFPGCGETGLPDLDYGYQCTPGFDCPDCMQFNVMNSYGTGFDAYVAGADNYKIGWEHGGCSEGTVNPPQLDYGYQCTTGSNCPDCITFNVVNSSRTGFDVFKPVGYTLYNIGWEHGGCDTVTSPPLEFGLQCTSGVDCPNCNQFNVLNAAKDGFELAFLSNGYLKVGHIHGSCAGTIPDEIVNFAATDVEYNQITCTWSPATHAASYDLYMDSARVAIDVSSGFIYSHIGTAIFHVKAINTIGNTNSNQDSGTGLDSLTAPSTILDFNATDILVDKVICSWSNASGNPTPIYNLNRGGANVATDITSPYTDTFTGTADYYVEATNSEGSTNSNIDSGTGATEVVRNLFLLNVQGSSGTDTMVLTNGEIFTIIAI